MKKNVQTRKYDLRKIMKGAWELKKSWNARKLTFAECLKRAWARAKRELVEKKYYGMKFENNMTIEADGYERRLTRWSKGNHDRVYINGGSRMGDGYVDLKSGRSYLRGDLTYQVKMAKMILSMEF